MTNGFSARFGQALSGLVNVVTREPGEAWEGRVAYEGDRPFGGGLDRGLDRLALRAGGPLSGRFGLVAAFDVSGRMDADPVSAPAPADPARSALGRALPPARTTAASSGPAPPSWSCRSPSARPSACSACTRRTSGCSTIRPTSTTRSSRPAQRLRGDLVSGHLQYTSDPRSGLPAGARPAGGPIRARVPARRAGGAAGLLARRAHRVRASTSSARTWPGRRPPRPRRYRGFASRTPACGRRGACPPSSRAAARAASWRWNRFGETRFQLDGTIGGHAGARSLRRRRVRRPAGPHLPARARYLPSANRGDGRRVPVPARSAFSPRSAAAYAEGKLRIEDVAVTAGLRYDRFDAGQQPAGRGARRAELGEPPVRRQHRAERRDGGGELRALQPGAGLSVPGGRGVRRHHPHRAVPPGQSRTSASRRPRQYELSVRVRPKEKSCRFGSGVYVKRLDRAGRLGADRREPGLDDLRQRRCRHRARAPSCSSSGSCAAGSASAWRTRCRRRRRPPPTPSCSTASSWWIRSPATPPAPRGPSSRSTSTGGTRSPPIARGKVADQAGPAIGGVRPLAGLEGAVILRLASGLPFSMSDSTGDSLVGLPNGSRLPNTSSARPADPPLAQARRHHAAASISTSGTCSTGGTSSRSGGTPASRGPTTRRSS